MMTRTKVIANTGKVIFINVIEVAQGGFTLDDSGFVSGDVVPAGTVIGFDESTRIAKVAKAGKLQANVANNVTAYPVLKGHQFKVGQSITVSGGTPRAITSITTTDPDFDALNVGTTIGAAASAGAAIYVSDAGYTGAKGLLYADAVIDSNGIADIAVVLRGTVYDRRIAPIPDSLKATLLHIIFSQSY
jgi:hypothetical protein